MGTLRHLQGEARMAAPLRWQGAKHAPMKLLLLAVCLILAPAAHANDENAPFTVDVTDNGAGGLSDRIVFRLREKFRASRAFKVATLAPGQIRLYVVATPLADNPKNEALSVVWTMVSDTPGVDIYITSSVYLVGANRLAEEGEMILTDTEKVAQHAQKMIPKSKEP